jgi:hypothetical protein
MSQYFALLFLGLCSIKCGKNIGTGRNVMFVTFSLAALAINCHATNITALLAGNIQQSRHDLVDCNVYMTNMMGAQGSGNKNVSTNLDFRCYTVVVDTGR